MAEDQDGPSGFKVVDRRTFTTEGARREDAPVKEARTDSSPGPRRPAPSELTPESPGLVDAEPSGFDTLVSYLSTTAMFQLGMIAGPSGERIPVDLPNARRTIDLLEILQEKTQGNLTPDESRLLDDVLYELRMTFVELEKRLARKAK